MKLRIMSLRTKLGFGLGLLAMVIAGAVGLYILGKHGTSPFSAPAGPEGQTTVQPLRVGFALSSGIGDFGWSYRQNEGREGLQAEMLDEVETLLFEGVYESQACSDALQRMAEAQVDLIFLMTDLHPELVAGYSGQHPSIQIVQWMGTPRPPNLGASYLYDHETAYLCGQVAALTPQTGQRFAVLAAYNNPAIRWAANAFALGARHVRENIEIEFRVLNTWYDPEAEQAAIHSLAADGVTAVYVITIAPVQAVRAAEQAQVYVLSHFGDLSSFAPTRWLTGTERVWHRLYADIIRKTLEGGWEAAQYGGGLREGYVKLASFGPGVPPDVIGRVRETTQALASGQRHVFQGPVRDNRGALRIPAGESARWLDLLHETWMVEGILPATESASRQTADRSDSPALSSDAIPN